MELRYNKVLFVFLVLLMMYSRSVFAQGYEGFFTKITGEIGKGVFEVEKESGDKREYSADSSAASLQLGYAIKSSFLVHGGLSTLFNLETAEPTPELPDAEGYSVTDTSYGVGALLLGSSYYFLEKAYVSLYYRYIFSSIQTTQRESTRINDQYRGNGYGVGLGYEWRLSHSFILGVGLIYYSDFLKGIKRTRTHPGGSSGRQTETAIGDLEAKHDYIGLGISLTFD